VTKPNGVRLSAIDARRMLAAPAGGVVGVFRDRAMAKTFAWRAQ
jgi:hypothetical protein